jgi:hypothetical protein
MATGSRRRSPKSRVYAVSGKDRGAINMAGHKADGVFWLETRFGMTTWVEPGQDAKAKLAPVAAFNAKLTADQKKKPFVWTYADKRCAALEGDYVTGGRAWRAALPRPVATDEAGVTNDLSVSPYTDRVTLEAAQALREEFKLGDGEATDVLTISLSATDFIGHRYGTKGPEMCDHLLRLDDRLGAFLDSLDKVKGQVLVVLAADHGGSDFPERLAQQGYDAGRVPPTQWLKDLNAAVREQLTLAYDPLVQAGGIESLYVVGADGKAPTVGDQARVTAAVLAILAKRPEVLRRLRLQHPVHDGPAAQGHAAGRDQRRRTHAPQRLSGPGRRHPGGLPALPDPGLAGRELRGQPRQPVELRPPGSDPVLVEGRSGARTGAADRDGRHRPDDRRGHRRDGPGRRGRAMPAAGGGTRLLAWDSRPSPCEVRVGRILGGSMSRRLIALIALALLRPPPPTPSRPRPSSTGWPPRWTSATRSSTTAPAPPPARPPPVATWPS